MIKGVRLGLAAEQGHRSDEGTGAEGDEQRSASKGRESIERSLERCNHGARKRRPSD